MIRILTIQAPRFFRTKRGVTDEFQYSGLFVSYAFEAIIRELFTFDEDDDIQITTSSVVLQIGDTITVDSFFQGEMEFLVIDKTYEH